MKVEARIFEIVTAFFFISAVIYGLWAAEPIGTTALTLTGGLTLIVGTYFRFVSRRVKMRPEDDTEAEVSDGAGEMGFFSPGSYWPITVALAATLAGYAVAFGQWWLLGLSLVAVLMAVAGLVFEYHVGPNRD